jgi:hypothetical protein
MRVFSLAIGMLAAFSVTGASAQSVNLTGAYTCVQMCRGGLVGHPAYITQNGPDLNLLTETGAAYRAWPDWLSPTTPSGSMRWARALFIRRTAWLSSSTAGPSGSAIWVSRRRAVADRQTPSFSPKERLLADKVATM